MIRRASRQKGLTLIEVTIVMTILAIVGLAVSHAFVFFNKQGLISREKSFAAQKAIQMMEELRGLVSNKSAEEIGVLDSYDDGLIYNEILTTRAEVIDPGDPISGNGKRNYVRRIAVVPIGNDSLARQVYVRVYRNNATYDHLAEASSVLRTISTQYEKTQVFDVYVLALENVPGWWVALSQMKPMLDNIIQDLHTRNPGMEWRVHWVTRLAYGRDPYYTPYINEATSTTDTAPPDVYFYPGLNGTSGNQSNYYVPGFFKGRINIDGTVQNDDSYSIADQYNHGVRYPDEKALYDQAVEDAETAGTAPPEISLAMLLEKMNSTDQELENLLVINLHGELYPLPPIRNYSDAAKDIANHANVRVVTHPEKLEYGTGSQVNLRVYPYVMNPGSWATNSTLSTTTVLIKDVALVSSNITVRRVTGSNTANYAWSNATHGTHYTVSNPGGSDTLITLYNLPLRHPARSGGSGGGLPSGERLYGLEYIPCLVQNSSAFSEGTRDLDSSETNRPKNTARVVIRIAGLALSDGEYAVETRIGDDLTTGVSTHVPTNVSRTFFWIGQTPPTIEQYQFMGDPRHMPYADVKDDNRFNWWFRTVNSSDWPGFSARDYNGYTGGINFDVPRYWQMYREGLMNSNGLMNTITGFTFYYVGVGGEIGNDIRIRDRPWNPTGNSVKRVNEILTGTGSDKRRYMRVISNQGNTWWGLYWLGELYPDSEFSDWVTNGNLPVGSGGYYRANFSDKGFSYKPAKRIGSKGCASFFNGNKNGNNDSKYFNHEFADGRKGNIQSSGNELAQDFNFPLLPTVSASRPFRLDYSGSGRRPTEWNISEYSSQRTTLSTVEKYYNSTYSSSVNSSTLVKITRSGNAGYMLVNGVSTQGDFGAAQIGKLCVLSLLRGFMRVGDPAISTGRIPQLPLISVDSPKITDQLINPSTVTVQWSTSWTRWDSQLYTDDYTDPHTESTALVVNVKYSDDNGKTWYFVQDNIKTKEGVMKTSYNTATPYDWDISGFGAGKYIVRVEIYRRNIPLHYAYHQTSMYVRR